MGLFSAASKKTTTTTVTNTNYSPTTITSSNTSTINTDSRKTIIDSLNSQVNQPIAIVGSGAEALAKGTGLDFSSFFSDNSLTSDYFQDIDGSDSTAADNATGDSATTSSTSNILSKKLYIYGAIVGVVLVAIFLFKRK